MRHPRLICENRINLLTMSEPSIVTKIRALLENGVNDERKVVYLLVECRKLADAYPRLPMEFALNLYINWAVHVDLSYTSTTLDFLKRVDEFASNFLADQNFAQQYNMFREFKIINHLSISVKHNINRLENSCFEYRLRRMYA